MPELLTMGFFMQARRTAPLLLGALALLAFPTRSLAQSVPASLRACTTESDPGQRLACYDREMARLSPSSARQPAEPAPVAADRASSTVPAQVPRTVTPPPQPKGAPRAEGTASGETPTSH